MSLTFAVEGITIAGNLLEMLMAIEAVGNDLDFRSSVSAPTVKVARMTVAGE
ncbi:peptidase PmbA [compost metagenome]